MATEITIEKFLSLQVCSDEQDMERLIELVNELRECGTTLGWVPSRRLEPVACAKYPERRHYIFDA